jgi:hypothetical protein
VGKTKATNRLPIFVNLGAPACWPGEWQLYRPKWEKLRVVYFELCILPPIYAVGHVNCRLAHDSTED